MPEWCLTTRCIDCESHAIVHGKLDCNYMNRLGLSQPTVKSFMEGEPDTPEKIKARIVAEKLKAKEAAEKIEGYRKLLEEHKGEE